MSDDFNGPDPLAEYDALVAGLPAADLASITDFEEHAEQPAPAPMLTFFAKRGVSEDTVAQHGVYARAVDDKGAMVWPWRSGADALVHRSTRVAGAWQDESGGAPVLYNEAAGLAAVELKADILFAGDELEAMAWTEAGFAHVLALPRRNPGAALGRVADRLDQVQRFNISPTVAPERREELARRLGRHRVWVVEIEGGLLPHELLVAAGRDALVRCVNNAEPYPIDGSQVVRPGMLQALRDRPPIPTMTTGIPALDDEMRIPTEGRLIVITGVPGHGKSSLLSNIVVHTARMYNRRWGIYSPEMSPWQEYIGLLAQILGGKPLRASRRYPKHPPLTADDIRHAEAFFRSRVVMFEHDSEDKAPDLDWLLNLARVEVLRRGLTDIAIDPWTEIEVAGDGSRDNGVQALKSALQRIVAFGKRHSVNMWVVAHPTKLIPPKPGAAIPPPGFYDIAGGAQWFNKTTLGLTVHINDAGGSEVYMRKVRFTRLGRRNGVAKLEFDPATSIYKSAGGEPPSAQGRWNDI